jgi:hypothetical protein
MYLQEGAAFAFAAQEDAELKASHRLLNMIFTSDQDTITPCSKPPIMQVQHKGIVSLLS